jgi:hypothetical protein
MTAGVGIPSPAAIYVNPDGTPTVELYSALRKLALNQNSDNATLAEVVDTVNTLLETASSGNSNEQNYALLVNFLAHPLLNFITLAIDPVAADLPDGQYAVFKNTGSGAVSLWANDGGILKSVLLT